jgi:hypothetical protein
MNNKEDQGKICRITEEIVALIQAIDIFASQVKERVLRKYFEGYGGWDDLSPENIVYLEKKRAEKLIGGEAASPNQDIDVAAFSAFIWRAKKLTQRYDDLLGVIPRHVE